MNCRRPFRTLFISRTIICRKKSQKKNCVVYLANTVNPYANLAFEDWMFEKVDFHQNNCLFIWRNEPSVVIGRNQNPWKECDVSNLLKQEINICRRRSGGGAVYHDLGNVNFTFFTDRKTYDRKHNLNLICSGLRNKWPTLDVCVNKRDDIILNNRFKISGSASKLGRLTAYHHCTLLVRSHIHHLTRTLSTNQNITSNATDSLSADVMNLSDVIGAIDFRGVCDAISESYMNEYESAVHYDITTTDEAMLPGVSLLSKQLQTWEWIFGKTPEFSVKHEFSNCDFGEISLKIQIKKGLIDNFRISSNNDDVKNMLTHMQSLLRDTRFYYDDVAKVLSQPSSTPDSQLSLYEYLSTCILSFMK